MIAKKENNLTILAKHLTPLFQDFTVSVCSVIFFDRASSFLTGSGAEISISSLS